ncbi:MAG: MFS transporter [Terriglobales bacterium]
MSENRTQTAEVASPANAINGVEARLLQGVAQEQTVAPQLPATSVVWPRVARALSHRNFRLFWTGNLISNVGTWMQNVAQGWLVLQLAGSNSAFWLGLVGFASSLPMLGFSLVGGVIADRVNRRYLLMVTQSAMMIFAFVLAALTHTQIVTIGAVVLLAFATGLAMSLTMPAYQAMQTELVPREDLTNAIALNSTQFNLARIIGPTLGGFGILWVGMVGNFVLNGLSFLAVLIALAAIHYPPRRPGADGGGMWADLAAGFRYVHRERVMFLLVLLVALASIFGIPYFIFIPLFAKEILHLTERGFGLLMACSGVGALLGATTMAYIGRTRRRGRLVVSFTVAFLGAIVLFSLSRWAPLSGLMLAIIGFSMVMAIANVNALLQHLSSLEMRGRVMSIYTCAFLGLTPLGSLFAGSVAKWIGAPHAIAGMASVALIGTILMWIMRPELRRLD